MDKHKEPGDPVVVFVLVAVVVLASLLLRSAWRHPMATAGMTVSALAYLAYGPLGLAGLWATFLLSLAAWRWVHPVSFDRSVAWRVRGSWQGW